MLGIDLAHHSLGMAGDKAGLRQYFEYGYLRHSGLVEPQRHHFAAG